jgi:hypothetical protein
MTNRHDRRIAQAKLRRQRREVSSSNYNPITDRGFLKGISNIVREVDSGGLEKVGGLCPFGAASP